jgi:hypothetical protein
MLHDKKERWSLNTYKGKRLLSWWVGIAKRLIIVNIGPQVSGAVPSLGEN